MPSNIQRNKKVLSQKLKPGISIKDNGIGFDLKESPRLFKVFNRLESAKNFEGSGILIQLQTTISLLKLMAKFIINKSKIDHIEGNRLFINQAEISIGRNYKESFLKSLGL